MSNYLSAVFDPYDRKARLAPALFCALPLIISSFLLVPHLDAIWSAVSGLLLYGGGAMFLTQIGRDRGKVLEPELFRSWGGKTSVAMLRHSDTRLTDVTKNRYKSFLVQTVPELHLESAEDEQEDPEKADEGYESAVSWLLAQTRDHERFALLFRENINYGFRRNVWALKPFAFGLETVAVATLVFLALDSWTGELSTTAENIGTEWWASLVVTVIHGLFFVFKIRKDWVRLADDAYARQLLAACDVLESRARSVREAV